MNRESATIPAAKDAGFLSISRLAELYRARSVSPVEITKLILERIEQLNPIVNAWIHIDSAGALQAARESEAAFTRGTPRGRLEGVPIGIKDCFEVRGMPTTFGSRVRVPDAPRQDGTAVARLRSSGAVLIGKTNLMEFCIGDDMESPFGRCSNPWDLSRITRGSSSGSAVAVASGLAFGALGSDTGGSIRAPSSYCGVVGMKPSYGRVSRRGTGDVAWSMDHAGPIGREVEDVAILLEAIAGPDAGDATTAIDSPVPQAAALNDFNISGIRIGIVPDYPPTPVTSEVSAAFDTTKRVMRDAGANLVEVSIPSLRHANDAAWLILSAEAASIHRDLLAAQRGTYTPSTRRRLEIGERCLAQDYLLALRYRAQLIQEFAETFESVDIILWPTMFSTAGLPHPVGQDADLTLNLELRAPYNIAGLPAITVPVGLDHEGLPIGMQIAGPLYADGIVLKAAKGMEAMVGWVARQPAGVAGFA